MVLFVCLCYTGEGHTRKYTSDQQREWREISSSCHLLIFLPFLSLLPSLLFSPPLSPLLSSPSLSPFLSSPLSSSFPLSFLSPSLPLFPSLLPTVYEAMESYVPQNEDEIGFNTGDKIEVLSKSMDGWWKIRCVVCVCWCVEVVVEVGRER